MRPASYLHLCQSGASWLPLAIKAYDSDRTVGCSPALEPRVAPFCPADPRGRRDVGAFNRLLFDVLDRDEFDDCKAVLFPGDDLEVFAEVVKVKEPFEVGP